MKPAEYMARLHIESKKIIEKLKTGRETVADVVLRALLELERKKKP